MLRCDIREGVDLRDLGRRDGAEGGRWDFACLVCLSVLSSLVFVARDFLLILMVALTRVLLGSGRLAWGRRGLPDS